MNLSLNEIEVMCKRAARGAGLPWGLAEEAAAASRFLTEVALPGADMLARLLERNDRRPVAMLAPMAAEGCWRAVSGRLCPVIAGSVLSDRAAELETGAVFEMEEVDLPLLLLPFAAAAAQRLDRPVALDWPDLRLVTDGRQISVIGATKQMLRDHVPWLCCHMEAKLGRPLAPVQRGQVAEDVWAQLSAFAHRTYAPASEASRLRGAGAGLTDND
ncbi:hypothetical protein JL2886_00960 [Phaeobacter gallaeciensis]|uniref:DUF3726 domain-containing protein n=1 Tax=Phaeobacter gallaeciensis TaxID=60890 RepID=A0A1B0ZNX1_9RHOB|nr:MULTISPECIES: DUF3726 domain-containing protein [Phaeobacter]MDF1770792.1 DUF3726 domain-containing protein [Pseudophaeobacter sp. bin_em_oilr2.035]MEE2634041.1 DUF3726 domain-containing protein [Pseudomonadota bacterium]ANP35882.1 hypothetical protein JL2886_00960 [Phaeobacter gallaeciensis]MDE4062363.1 DUF3726 domain-containing protein [Phaeobacter gallaeciensis]MDE4125219.1 DUF3726 domain-containing protein [Phaeobacter gallaeciensis]